MKYPIIILFLFFSISILSQRDIIYDLDSYKQVVFKRSELVISPSGGIEGSDEVNVDGAETNINIDLSMFAQHQKFKNTEDEQYTSIQSATINIAKGYFLNGNKKIVKRKYSGNKYFKTGYETSLRYNRLRNRNTGVQENEGNARLLGDFGMGFGRIENVNHAWTAIQVLQGLENNGLLLKIPAHEKITEFANLIGAIRTSRILDFRLRDIAILETILDYLIDNKLIDQLSTKAILIIEDTFEYDIASNRNTGSRFEMSLQPFSRYTKNPQNSFISRSLNIGVVGIMDHLSYKNINSQWMRSIRYGGTLNVSNYYQYITDQPIENFTSTYVVAGLEYDYMYLYLASLRNNFSFGIDSQISMNATFIDSQPTQYSAAKLNVNLTTAFNHYFSPATQFRVVGQLGYNDPEFQAGDFQPRINGYLDFAITHAIF